MIIIVIMPFAVLTSALQCNQQPTILRFVPCSDIHPWPFLMVCASPHATLQARLPTVGAIIAQKIAIVTVCSNQSLVVGTIQSQSRS